MLLGGGVAMANKWMVLFGVALFLGVPLSVNAQGKPAGAPVEIVPVAKETVEKQVTLIGTVFPLRKSDLASEVEGLVERVFVEEGSFVKKGDRIAELGSSVYELQLEEAEAARKETEQRYLQAKSDLERSEDLVKKGFVPEKQLLDDRFRTDALLKRLQQHEAEIDRLKDVLGKTNIVAPFSGEVVKKHTEVGQWVNKGGVVVTLIDLSRVHVTVSVPERYVFHLKVGQPAFVTADALAGKTYEGTIDAIISEGDVEARTFPVKFEVLNKGFKLKSGMLARVTFSTGSPRKGLLVPKDALVSQGQAVVVFVVADGMARQIPVRVEGYHGDRAEVRGKVQPGDPVVVRGNERLRDGQPVQAFPAQGQT
jgi:RND family efflux transporter MFP subunit